MKTNEQSHRDMEVEEFEYSHQVRQLNFEKLQYYFDPHNSLFRITGTWKLSFYHENIITI